MASHCLAILNGSKCCRHFHSRALRTGDLILGKRSFHRPDHACLCRAWCHLLYKMLYHAAAIVPCLILRLLNAWTQRSLYRCCELSLNDNKVSPGQVTRYYNLLPRRPPFLRVESVGIGVTSSAGKMNKSMPTEVIASACKMLSRAWQIAQ